MRRAYPYTVLDPVPDARLFITVAEVRDYLRLGPDPDPPDAEVVEVIRQAQAIAERFTGLTFFNTKFRTFRDYFHYDFRSNRDYYSSSSDIELRQAPLIDVEEISFLRTGEFEIFDNTKYKAISVGMNYYGSITLKEYMYWPVDIDTERESIKIDFNAGFGADAASLPPDLVAGTKRILADLYENRGDCDASYMLSGSAKQFLNRFIIMSV